MDNTFSRELTILPSVCDSSAKLGIPDTFALFMDIATEHAEQMGVGAEAMARQNLFWLTVRTRIRFYRRPAMMERVTASTWPEEPGKLRCNRDYTLTEGGKILIGGKTEWAVMETRTGKLRPAKELYPSDMRFDREPVWDEPFCRIDEAFDGAEELGTYRVASTDIDLGGHMNNAAYARMLAGMFSCKEWEAMKITDVELAFRAPCYEGDTLQRQKKRSGETMEFRAALPDGKTVLLARIS